MPLSTTTKPSSISGSAVFCLSSKSGFVAEQWVREESKSLKSGVNGEYYGWMLETRVGVGFVVYKFNPLLIFDFQLELLNPMIFMFKC